MVEKEPTNLEMGNWAAAVVNALKQFEHAQEVYHGLFRAELVLAATKEELASLQEARSIWWAIFFKEKKSLESALAKLKSDVYAPIKATQEAQAEIVAKAQKALHALQEIHDKEVTNHEIWRIQRLQEEADLNGRVKAAKEKLEEVQNKLDAIKAGL